MCHKMVKNCHHLFRRYCEEDYKQFHLLVQTWRHPTEQAYHDKIWLIALYLSWIPFIFYQTLWYLYFCPKLNLSILWLNPWSTRVLTASTPCSSASSICPDSYYQLKFLTVLKENKIYIFQTNKACTKMCVLTLKQAIILRLRQWLKPTISTARCTTVIWLKYQFSPLIGYEHKY